MSTSSTSTSLALANLYNFLSTPLSAKPSYKRSKAAVFATVTTNFASFANLYEINSTCKICLSPEAVLPVWCRVLKKSEESDSIGNLTLLSIEKDEADLIDRDDEQKFLASADYLTNVGLPNLISCFGAATSEVLKGKQLKDFFNTSVLHDAIVQILDTFMSMGSPHQWLSFLMPAGTSGNTDPSPASKFEQLVMETRAVLSSVEFENILDISLKSAVDVMMEDIRVLCGETNLTLGIPLAKLLPRLAHMSRILLEEPNRNRYIQIVQNMPEVEMFFTLLYASTPAS